mmetsp:Transcript_22587/g.20058  ORF Transcript_22587/g.20058 Transcript_22587/m.20058 type:complete len:88 (+) Transcript_22587:205-468(+)
MRKSYEILKEDIGQRIEEAMNKEMEDKGKDAQLDVEQFKTQFGFKDVSLSFAIILKSYEEEEKSIFLQINYWSEEAYEELRIGQVID